jgi:hypothetical protein
MYTEDLQDLSVLYFIKSIFSDAPFIKVVDSYDPSDLTVPTIAVESEIINGKTFELGNRAFGKIRVWLIDIFADTKAQRDQYAYRILHELENKIPVYDYNVGFPPDVTPPKVGALDPQEVQLNRIQVLPDLTELMYYRSVVRFTTVYNEI